MGRKKTTAPRLRASSRTALLTEPAYACSQTGRDAVFSSAYGRRYWGAKTCTFKPYSDCSTVLQYYSTTVQIRQYDDTTTVTAVRTAVY